VPIDGLFSSRTLEVLKRGLDAFAIRGRVISDNIANASTEGYRAKRVDFEEDLKEALERGPSLPARTDSPRHIPINSLSVGEVEPRVVESEEPAGAGEPNNVVIEREMADLAQNEILFDFAARQVATAYSTMKGAIRGTMR
jgi:flagellar basal-body rod protein FlgB